MSNALGDDRVGARPSEEPDLAGSGVGLGQNVDLQLFAQAHEELVAYDGEEGVVDHGECRHDQHGDDQAGQQARDDRRSGPPAARRVKVPTAISAMTRSRRIPSMPTGLSPAAGQAESKEGSIARAVVVGVRAYALMHDTASPGVGTTTDDERPRRAA
jgi:hypothetical protein